MMIGSKVHPARRRVVPSQMNSVFDAFNLRRLLAAHGLDAMSKPSRELGCITGKAVIV